jgi:hypothetical protein
MPKGVFLFFSISRGLATGATSHVPPVTSVFDTASSSLDDSALKLPSLHIMAVSRAPHCRVHTSEYRIMTRETKPQVKKKKRM